MPLVLFLKSFRNAGCQFMHSLYKTRHRRMHEARADLAYARETMGDACIDDGQVVLAYNLPDVDTGGRAAKTERRQLKIARLGDRDVVHFQRVAHGIGWRAADELRYGGSRCHRKAADASRLRNGAVANIGVGILLREAAEVESLNLLCRSHEPALSQSAYPDAEIGAIACHRRHHAAERDAVRSQQGSLAHRHRQVEVYKIVALHVAQHADRLFAGIAGLHQVGRDLAREERGGSLVAVVALVAHLQRLRRERYKFDATGGPHGAGHRRSQHLRHPAQLRDHLRAVGSIAQHLTESLIECTEGLMSINRLLDDLHGHGRGNHPRHRPYRVVVVTGGEDDVATICQLFSFGNVRRHFFIEQRAEYRAAQGTGHALPGDGRPGVQQQVLLKPRNGLACRTHIYQSRTRRHHALYGLLIRLIDALVIEQGAEGGIAVAWRGLPGNSRDRRALFHQRVGEKVSAHVDDAQR